MGNGLARVWISVADGGAKGGADGGLSLIHPINSACLLVVCFVTLVCLVWALGGEDRWGGACTDRARVLRGENGVRGGRT